MIYSLTKQASCFPFSCLILDSGMHQLFKEKESRQAKNSENN